MEVNIIRKYKMLFYPAFFIITLITFFPLFFTGLGCGDDLHDYLIAFRGDYFENAKSLSFIAGRFYFYLVAPVHNLPYLWDNMVITKLFQIVPLISCFILFAVILFKLTHSRELASLYFLLFLSLSQVSGYTSLFVTYPFFFTFSFGLLLISFLLLLQFFEKKKKKLLVYSALLYAIGILFYEVYVFFFLFVALTILAYNLKEDKSVGSKIKVASFQLLPYLVVVIIYIAAYLIFRFYHPSLYDGTTIDSKGFSFCSFFKVLWALSYSALPTTIFESSRTYFTERSELIQGYSPVILKIMLTGKVEWIVKGILTSICGYLLLVNIAKLRMKYLLIWLGMGILLVFLPHIPLALTTKYTYYVSYGMIGYVTTFFSLFGVLLVITMVVLILMNVIGLNSILKKVIAAISIVVLFGCSIVTDFSNYMVAKDIRSANLRFIAMNELIKSEPFQTIPERSSFYMNDLYNNPSYSAHNLTEQDFNWANYIYEKTSVTYFCSRTEKEFRATLADTTTQLYYVNMKQALKTEDIFISLGRIDRETMNDSVLKKVYVNRALFLYYSPYKIFSISFRCKEDPLPQLIPLRINHIHDTIQPGKTVTFTIYNTKPDQPATIFTIDAWEIDLKSIMVSDMINPEDKIIYL